MRQLVGACGVEDYQHESETVYERALEAGRAVVVQPRILVKLRLPVI